MRAGVLPDLAGFFSSWVADLGHPGGLTEPDNSFGKPAAMQRDQDSPAVVCVVHVHCAGLYPALAGAATWGWFG